MPQLFRAELPAALVSANELAAMLSTSSRTIRRLDAAGKLPKGIRLGGLKRWRREEIAAWIHAGCPSRPQWEWK